jgi:hypothetical protein
MAGSIDTSLDPPDPSDLYAPDKNHICLLRGNQKVYWAAEVLQMSSNRFHDSKALMLCIQSEGNLKDDYNDVISHYGLE